ncbi:MAG: hypothetical protein NZ455_09300 [Bacteroidia bacterium]|nr:hypothetical protein [Bacteroidia bacterium]
MRRVGVSPVRSEAQHRSDSVARSTPTLWAYAQRNAHKDTPKKLKITPYSHHPKTYTDKFYKNCTHIK